MWTTEYPTEPGYYWLRNYNVKGLFSAHASLGPTIVEIHNDLVFQFTGEDVIHYKHNVISAEWCGPITPPVEQDTVCARCGRYNCQDEQQPDDKPRDLTELFYSRLTNRGKQLLTACAWCKKTDAKLITWTAEDLDGLYHSAAICRECYDRAMKAHPADIP